MSHYEPPTQEERKRARKRKEEKKKAVQNVLNQDPKTDIEQFIKESEGRTKHSEIIEFIQDKYINEHWLHDMLDSKWVARDVFDRVKKRSKQEARDGWKGMPEDEFIQKKTESWYEIDEVEPR